MSFSKEPHFSISIISSLVTQYATLTESHGVKIDGFLYPNFMQIPKMLAKSSSTVRQSGRFFSSFGEVKGDFSLLRSPGGGTFCLHFWNLHKLDISSVPFGRCCNLGCMTSVCATSFLIQTVNCYHSSILQYLTDRVIDEIL